MNVIITYDIEYNHFDPKNEEVKNAMKALGYDDSFFYQETIYYLPNTTLWKSNTSPIKAKNDLLAVAKKYKAKIERLFANQFAGNWEAIEGEPYEE